VRLSITHKLSTCFRFPQDEASHYRLLLPGRTAHIGDLLSRNRTREALRRTVTAQTALESSRRSPKSRATVGSRIPCPAVHCRWSPTFQPAAGGPHPVYLEPQLEWFTISLVSWKASVQCLRLLLFGQFVDPVPHLVIAATLHRLACSKGFFNGSSQGFCAVDHEQVFAVCRQTLIAQVSEQRLHRRSVFRSPHWYAEHMFHPGPVHSHRADDVMRSKALAIDVEHQ
jgi:hypothetical protein